MINRALVFKAHTKSIAFIWSCRSNFFEQLKQSSNNNTRKAEFILGTPKKVKWEARDVRLCMAPVDH